MAIAFAITTTVALAAGITNWVTVRQSVDVTIPAARVEGFIRQQVPELADSPTSLTCSIRADGSMRVVGSYTATRAVDGATWRQVRGIVDETQY